MSRKRPSTASTVAVRTTNDWATANADVGPGPTAATRKPAKTATPDVTVQ